jgi:arylsulfatase A-like enzyme
MYKNIEDPSRRAYAASITAMDDEIGRIVGALEKKGLRDNTLIVFQSDNGGTRNSMFSGEIDTSKLKIPCDNGPYREGKGTLYEGGSRVCALANWPGHVQPGITVEGMIHTVDLFPTLIGLAGASSAKSKPLDGIDVWSTISTNAVSPRTELIYNVEPFRAGIRQGDWKLIWRTPLPAVVELYNVAQDPAEKTNLADKYPDKVAELQKRANELAAAGVKPLLLQEVFINVKKSLHATPALPGDDYQFDTDPDSDNAQPAEKH